jgi:hypothetical protein
MNVVPLDHTKPRGTISPRETLSGSMRGKVSISSGFGLYPPGVAQCGYYFPISGIYCERPGGYNQFNPTGRDPKLKKRFRKIYYRPTNPQTVPQQAHRAIFAAAVAGWQSLTDEEKSVYNKRGSKRARRGMDLFISEYLNEHKSS